MSKGDKAGWKAAADASAKREAEEAPKKRGRPKKGEQTRLKIDSRDAVHIPAKHEIHRDMTHPEWEEQSALLANQRVELMTLEERIAALKRELAPRMKDLRTLTAQGARQCDVRKWLTMTDCIEVHDVNRNTVTVHASVNGELGVIVIPERPMRKEERERALKSAPFDPPVAPPEGEAEHDEEPEA